KRAPRSLQHHVLYRKYNGQDSEISALLGKCGSKGLQQTGDNRRTGAAKAASSKTCKVLAPFKISESPQA
ncbi:hypothetical protein, partial [Pseudochelatococcus contaminans]|uniref:hypothetical protein n=1 Tax=Pseudochelatococcus contaminans TaxID=1538103 RepID=UPI001AEF208E